MLSNTYFLSKFRFDTAENEPAKNLQIMRNFPILLTLTRNQAPGVPGARASSAQVGLRARARGGGRGERPLQVPASGFDLLAIDACKVHTRKRAQFCRQLNKILPK